MDKYIKEFFKNEDGIELIEFLSVVVIAAILILIGVNVGQSINKKMKNISKYI